ncbi:MAG: hypothetical protein K5650_01835 [Bacteroidales bacterium]|nr:hypothetical protein [Bacteroidales bacterium]
MTHAISIISSVSKFFRFLMTRFFGRKRLQRYDLFPIWQNIFFIFQKQKSQPAECQRITDKTFFSKPQKQAEAGAETGPEAGPEGRFRGAMEVKNRQCLHIAHVYSELTGL